MDISFPRTPTKYSDPPPLPIGQIISTNFLIEFFLLTRVLYQFCRLSAESGANATLLMTRMSANASVGLSRLEVRTKDNLDKINNVSRHNVNNISVRVRKQVGLSPPWVSKPGAMLMRSKVSILRETLQGQTRQGYQQFYLTALKSLIQWG